MSMLSRTRTVAAVALHASAALLAGTAKGIDAVAGLLRPGPDHARRAAREVAEEAGAREAVARRAGRRQEARKAAAGPAPRTRPYIVASGPGTARAPATHIEELAGRPAAEVIARVPDLSTEDLRLLAEYEQGHRKRKTVLAAIEDSAEDFAR